ADHFSQPGLFWRSQADWEQAHIVDAFCFELGKVSVPAIRELMLANLTQVDATLAQRVADGLAEQAEDSLDLVLCNPPFHQQQVVGDFLAWRMFQ
ncbi:catalase-related domain-containing protein, partial [Pseudomonas peli]|uniref:catalase-related domain-containing protein n=1 Tax=Pseudomonas peli TaxID=592361 RepID=UPI003D3113CD